jgi:hypothetical protein
MTNILSHIAIPSPKTRLLHLEWDTDLSTRPSDVGDGSLAIISTAIAEKGD